MKRIPPPSLALATLTLFPSACFVAPESQVFVESDLAYATRRVRRGMTQVDGAVARPGLRIVLPVDESSSVMIDGRGTVNLEDDSPNAWLPPGHGGELSELDFGVLYLRTLGRFDLSAGITSYNLPNGTQFTRSTERGGSAEVFVAAAIEAPLGLLPRWKAHWDFDEANGFYLEHGIQRVFDLDPLLHPILPRTELGRWSVILDGTHGLSDGGHSLWAYGLESTSQDISFTGTLEYLWDENTRLFLAVAWSRVIDSTMEAWFDTIRIDSDSSWLALGMTWGI